MPIETGEWNGAVCWGLIGIRIQRYQLGSDVTLMSLCMWKPPMLCTVAVIHKRKWKHFHKGFKSGNLILKIENLNTDLKAENRNICHSETKTGNVVCGINLVNVIYPFTESNADPVFICLWWSQLPNPCLESTNLPIIHWLGTHLANIFPLHSMFHDSNLLNKERMSF